MFSFVFSRLCLSLCFFSESQKSHLSSFTMKLMKFHSPKIKRTPSKKGKQLQVEPTVKTPEKPVNKVEQLYTTLQHTLVIQIYTNLFTHAATHSWQTLHNIAKLYTHSFFTLYTHSLTLKMHYTTLHTHYTSTLTTQNLQHIYTTSHTHTLLYAHSSTHPHNSTHSFLTRTTTHSWQLYTHIFTHTHTHSWQTLNNSIKLFTHLFFTL